MKGIFALIFIVVSLQMFFAFIKVLYFYFIQIKKWKVAEAKIIYVSCDLVKDEGSHITGWENNVKYSYEIDNEFYEGTTITKNITFLPAYKGGVTKNKYEVNNRIKIMYNPTNPFESIIDVNFSYTNLLYLLVGFFSFWISYNFYQDI